VAQHASQIQIKIERITSILLINQQAHIPKKQKPTTAKSPWSVSPVAPCNPGGQARCALYEEKSSIRTLNP
jgi:hypothetical protein